MAGFVLRVVIVMVGLWIASVLVPGIAIRDVWTLLGAALLLGVINAIVRPVIVILTLPVTIVTLGLFLFVINAAMLGLAAAFFDGFHIAGFWAALFGSVIVSITGWIASYFIGPHGKVDIVAVRRQQ